MCTVHFGFLLSAALQFTTISEPALFRNDVHRSKDAPSQLSLLNDTLQRKDALHGSSALLNDNRGAVCKNIISDRFSTKSAISACRDVISGRDSYLCMQRCYLWQR